ncbi:phosphatase PAP2 family protein [Streptacidiphilus neutrinimicus]|uniref:phosphatase PAP2 family protein n=1 Tax=Streptacidiphilus neutrinimicus TaxID=105420 RepID=UPI0007C63E94|nr:phosphatase PAP2 family protein [Streptacidiphilus neutrinimicus]
MLNLTLSWQSAGALAAVAYGASVAVRRVGAPSPRRVNVGLVVREAATMIALFAVWQYAGQISVMSEDGAIERGQAIWDAERRLHLPSEQTLQSLVLPHPWLVQGANYYYASMHFGAMIALLVWVFLRHRHAYPWVRMTVVLVTAWSLLVQLIPVAPPRLLPGNGMIDVAVEYGQSVYGATLGGIQADSYSAMPSVHVAWCVLVAVAVIRLSRSRWRWLVLAHPVLTVAVVVVTANHYWLDGVAAVALLLLAYLVQWYAARLRAAYLLRTSPADEEAGESGAETPLGPPPAPVGAVRPADAGSVSGRGD